MSRLIPLLLLLSLAACDPSTETDRACESTAQLLVAAPANAPDLDVQLRGYGPPWFKYLAYTMTFEQYLEPIKGCMALYPTIALTPSISGYDNDDTEVGPEVVGVCYSMMAPPPLKACLQDVFTKLGAIDG